MDTKELLKQELIKRFQSDVARQGELDAAIGEQDFIARNMPMETQTDLTGRLQHVDYLTGGNLAQGYKAPEDQRTALRRALAYKMQQRRPDPLSSLAALAKLEQQPAAAQMRADKEAQRMREAAMKSDEGKSIITSRKLQDKVQRYQDLINEHGYQVSGEKRAELEGAYRELQIAYKNAAELGVIAGPDMMLIEGIAPPATGFKGLFKSGISGGIQGANRALDQLKTSRQQDIDTSMGVLKSVFQDPSTEGTLEGMFGGKPKGYSIGSDGGIDGMDFSEMSDEQLKRIAGGK